MTRASGREDAAVPRTRDQQATRAKNHRRVDAIVAVTGLPRKAALRLLRRAPRPRPSPGPGGRAREYGPEIAAAAAVRWPACGRTGAHRLPPFVPELLERLPQWGPPSRRRQAPAPGQPPHARPAAGAHPRPVPAAGATTTRPGTLLKHAIPIRTFTEWEDARPGFLEVDLVAPGGSPTEGFYLGPLCAVDIATAWVELDAVCSTRSIRSSMVRRGATTVPAGGLPRTILSTWPRGSPSELTFVDVRGDWRVRYRRQKTATVARNRRGPVDRHQLDPASSVMLVVARPGWEATAREVY